MQLDLSGRHALVCGASHGIGRASAVELAGLGADVTLLARSGAALEAVVASLPRPCAGQRHGWRSVDMLDTANLKAVAVAIAADRPVQILVNNTGKLPKKIRSIQISWEFTWMAFHFHQYLSVTMMRSYWHK